MTVPSMKRLALLLWILTSISPLSALSGPPRAMSRDATEARAPLIIWHNLDHRVSSWVKSAWSEAEHESRLGRHSRKGKDKQENPVQVYENVDFETALYPAEGDATNERPDALILSNDLIGLHQNFMLSEVPGSALRGIKPRFINTVKSDGQAFGVPLFVSDVLLLFYNKRMVSKPIQDTDHLAAMRSEDAQFTPITWPFAAPAYFAPFLLARDAWPRDARPIRLNTPEFVEALKSYQSMARSQVIDPSCDASCSSETFLSEKAPYAIAGLSFLQAARKALGKDLGVAPLPEVHKVPLRPVYGTYSLVFPLGALSGRKREALLRLARALSGEKAQRRLLRETLRIPVNATAFEGAGHHVSAETKVALHEMREAIPIPSRAEMTAYWSTLGKMLGMISDPTQNLELANAGDLAQRLYEGFQSRLKERR